MLLVFFILLIICLLIISLRFEIEIENFEYSNYEKQIPDNFKVKFRIFLINKLKILELKLNKEKMKKIYSKQKLEKIDTKKMMRKLPKSNKEKIKILEMLKLKKIKLYIEIGTEEIMLTTMIIPILSSLFSVIFSMICNKNDCYYKVNPIYIDENIYKINLDCIISIKMIHIIVIMWKILRKRVDTNERTSNRRSYAYRYE